MQQGHINIKKVLLIALALVLFSYMVYADFTIKNSYTRINALGVTLCRGANFTFNKTVYVTGLIRDVNSVSTHAYMKLWDGTVLAEAQLDGITANFTTPVKVTIGTHYVMCMNKTGAYDVYEDTTAPRENEDIGWWSGGAYDLGAGPVFLADYNWEVWGFSYINDIYPTYESPTPASGTANNTQVAINVSCVDGNLTLWFDNNTDPITMVIDNQPSPANWTTNVTVEDIYFYKGSCNGGTSNDTVRNWTYDITSPDITIQSNNFFSAANTTIEGTALQSATIHFLLEDNIDLYAFRISINHSNGTAYFNQTNTTLSGTSQDIIRTTNLTNYVFGRYYVLIEAADSHTGNGIGNYDYDWNETELDFWTEEGNYIRIVSLRNANWNVTRYDDRYRFTFSPWELDAFSKYKFQVWCDNGFVYKPHSGYDGHFVCMNSNFRGNWLDFHGTGAPVDVTDEGEGWFEIEIEFEGDSFTFDSLGGLNVNEQMYTFLLERVYPENPTLTVSGSQLWSYSGAYGISDYTTLNATVINNILRDGCSGGTIVGNFCRINLTFHSDGGGNIKY